MSLRCIAGKIRYSDPTIAEDALIDLWTLNDYSPGQGPIAIYCCDDCGDYHFTSKGTMNSRLEAYVRSPAFQRRRVASAWEQKLKKRWLSSDCGTGLNVGDSVHFLRLLYSFREKFLRHGVFGNAGVIFLGVDIGSESNLLSNSEKLTGSYLLVKEITEAALIQQLRQPHFFSHCPARRFRVTYRRYPI